MISKKSLVYLIWVSGLGLVIFFIPGLSLFGLIIPPVFFLLAVMPTIFIYSLTNTIFFILLKRAGKARYILAPVLTVILFLAIPYYFNSILDQKINSLIQDDISIKEPIPTGGMLALEIPSSYSVMGAKDNKCEAMCQTLLYNKAYQKISITLNGTRDYTYYLKNDRPCFKHNNLLDGVAEKISSGECLIESSEKIESPDFIYKVENIESQRQAFLSLNGTFKATRLTINNNKITPTKVIHRRTTVTARPLKYPLLVGVGGGYQLMVHTEFYRTEKTLNKPIDREAEAIFGVAALKPITINPEKKLQIIKSYLKEGVDSTGTAYRLTASLWDELAEQKTFSADDIEIMIDYLNNKKINLPFRLPNMISKMKTVPEELVAALGNNILYDPAYQASEAIALLPDGRASIIAPQLEQLANNQDRRSLYWRAFSRLGDGSDEAIDQYITVLNDYKRFMGKEINRHVMDKKENEVSGAIIGLCRLGKKAEKAKEDLYYILETGDRWTQPSSYTAKALLEIADMDELKKRYLENSKYRESDRVGKEIMRAIEYKKLNLEKGKNPCN